MDIMTHPNRAVVAAALLSLSVSVAADTVALNPQRPDTYVVSQGDTLWDIAGRFLREPTRWREVWEANPQLGNPHLIFPGDRISLVYRNGQPAFEVRRGGRPTVKLAPAVRESPSRYTTIPRIPVDAIQQFLSRTRVMTQADLDHAPYIMSVGGERVVASTGNTIYARGIEPGAAQRYSVFREGPPYRDPEAGDAIVGYEAVHVGEVFLEKPGDPAALVVIRANREMLAGDRLFSASEEEEGTGFVPHVPEHSVAGEIIAVVDGVTQIGQHQIVVINRGAADQLEPGHVLAVYQGGSVVDEQHSAMERQAEKEPESRIELDPEQQGGLDGFTVAADRVLRHIQDLVPSVSEERTLVELPASKAGTLLVFRPYERLSYALVMRASRAIRVRDSVGNP